MFARAEPSQFMMPWAAVTKLGVGSGDLRAALDAGFLVASNICNADDADDSCTRERDEGIANGVHMLKDDFPAKVSGRSYWLQLPDGNPVRCNPITAPSHCTPKALEDL